MFKYLSLLFFLRSGFDIANSKGVFSGLCRKACVKTAFFLLFLLASLSYSRTLTASFSEEGLASDFYCGFGVSVNRVYVNAGYGNIAEYFAPGGSQISIVSASVFGSSSYTGTQWVDPEGQVPVSGSDGCSNFQFAESGFFLSGGIGCVLSWYVNDWVINFSSRIKSATCVITFTVEDDDTLPQCSDFLPIPAPACKGGTGLWAIGSAALNSAPGVEFGGVFIWSLGLVGLNDRPDGSQCQHDGLDIDIVGYVCPLGPADDEPSSSSAAVEPEPSSSSKSGSLCDDPEELINNPACACRLNPSDPSCNYDVCERYPSLYGCQPDTISPSNICDSYPGLPGCGNFPGDTLRGGMGGLGSGDIDTVGSGGGPGPGGGDSGGNTVVGGVVGAGGNCTSLSNCDWSKLSVQLQQLGVDVETRDLVRDLLKGALVLSDINYRQENLLRDVNDALSDGFGNVSDSLSGFKGLLGRVLDSVSGGLSGLRGSLDSGFAGMSDGLSGLRGSLDSGFAGLPGTIADALGKWLSDTSGSGGFGDSLSGWGSDGFGGTGSQMGDSLGDGSVIRGKIRSAVGIDSSSFSFLGGGGACPVINASFDSGVHGIKNSKNINLCDIYGFNVASALRAFLWLVVLVSGLWMNLEILRTGGRS